MQGAAMIPEEHLPAVDHVCEGIIWAAWHTQAEVSDMMAWTRERMRTFYDHTEVDGND